MNKCIIAVLGAVLFLTGCAGARWEDTTINEHRHYTVRIQHYVSEGRVAEQQYRHPAIIETGTVAALLSELVYLYPPLLIGENKETKVFQEEEVNRLAPALAGAFETLSSNQRIAFTSYNRGGGLLFKKPRRTDGAIFMDDAGRLNVAFFGINVEMSSDAQVIAMEDNSLDNAIAVKTSRTPLVIKRDYMQPVFQKSGEAYPMWITADAAGIKKAMKIAPRETAASPDDVIAPDAHHATHREMIREKLEYLKELYDDGLIKDSEYEEKRKALIDSIE